MNIEIRDNKELPNENLVPQLDNRKPEKPKVTEPAVASHPRSERTGKQSRQKDMKKSQQSI
jgi:hypothetical protein